jgi:hypothetical protein
MQSFGSACGIRSIFDNREPELTGNIVSFLQMHSSFGGIVECGKITAAANGERVHLVAWQTQSALRRCDVTTLDEAYSSYSTTSKRRR